MIPGASIYHVVENDRNQGRPARSFRVPFDSRFGSHHESRVVPKQRAAQIRLSFYGDQQLRICCPGHYVRLPRGCWHLYLPCVKCFGAGRYLVPVECPLEEIHRTRDPESDGLEPDPVPGRYFTPAATLRRRRFYYPGTISLISSSNDNVDVIIFDFF